MRAARKLGVDATRIASALASRLDEINDELLQLLRSPLGKLAGSIEVRPEVALAYIATLVLAYAVDFPDGLDTACEVLRQELNQLERLLEASGESQIDRCW